MNNVWWFNDFENVGTFQMIFKRRKKFGCFSTSLLQIVRNSLVFMIISAVVELQQLSQDFELHKSAYN